MLNVYIIHASSRLACRDIQRIQRIQRIQLYSYTRYTAYSTIQPPSASVIGLPRAGGRGFVRKPLRRGPGRPPLAQSWLVGPALPALPARQGWLVGALFYALCAPLGVPT